ncbi:hypothetical protein E2562_018721 [Oryza meyeriana var. granulata]|uniref:Poly(A) polymerase nucleotidyltransferase domain-containing protein n=1 Tax=Oryza meyeriana var. granulata TaxID=110450 RepID=A0A6G1EMR2_9ORYZ|nr:hypothetical protein E2562_018721 [Oryza meyeriana var. granulata]
MKGEIWAVGEEVAWAQAGCHPLTGWARVTGGTIRGRRRPGPGEHGAARLYESVEETAVREEVLCNLRDVVDRWVKRLMRQPGYPDGMVDQATTLVLPFDSEHGLELHSHRRLRQRPCGELLRKS